MNGPLMVLEPHERTVDGPAATRTAGCGTLRESRTRLLAHPSWVSGISRGERHLVVDRVEGVLGKHLGRLHLAVPIGTAVRCRIGRVLVSQHLQDGQAGRTSEGGADALEAARASRSAA